MDGVTTKPADFKPSFLLNGIGVLDLADEKASFASRLLGDLGARVIKIEKPGGDPSRNIGPFWGALPDRERSLSFYYNNANKLGITLNLEQKEGRRLFAELVKKNDIVIEAFAPGYLDDLGLGPDFLREINPGIVIVSVTAFGQDGPLRDTDSCDLIACATGGQMYVSGAAETPPLKVFGEQSYYVASLFAAISALLGIRKRRSDRGRLHFDISLQEAVVATLEYVLIRYFNDGVISKRQGNLHWDNGFCILPCLDGFILVTLFQQWQTLIEWMDSENMAEDLRGEQWNDEEFRRTHLDHIIEVLSQWTKTYRVNDLYEMAQAFRFPWAPVRSPREVTECSHLMARDFFVKIDHPEWNGSLEYAGMPYGFSIPVRETWKRAPRIGEHNVQIYHEELGMSLEDLERLFSAGAI